MIFVPMLHYLQNKNSFSGNEDGMRYLITPGKRSVPDPDGGEEAKKEEAILTVDLWPEPWTLDKTDPALRRREIFPMTEAGRTAVAQYLNDAYNAEPERWSAHPSILDCEPWTPPELAGIIEGKDLDIDLLEVDENEAALCSASAAGRGFAQSGGVANAVANKIKEWHPDMEVKIASAQGLADCKKLLMLAKAGKYNGYLLEGMGCPGGCIGGAGTIADPARTAIQLNKYMKEAPFTDPEQSPYMSEIHVLKDDPNFEL